MWAGLKHPSVWIGRAICAVILDRNAYREVAQDATMNVPGLLLVLASSLVAALVVNPAQWWQETLFRVGMWLLGVILILIAGRLLGFRGIPAPVGRAVAFAHSAYFVFLLGLIPRIRERSSLHRYRPCFYGYLDELCRKSEAERLARRDPAGRHIHRTYAYPGCRSGSCEWPQIYFTVICLCFWGHSAAVKKNCDLALRLHPSYLAHAGFQCIYAGFGLVCYAPPLRPWRACPWRCRAHRRPAG